MTDDNNYGDQESLLFGAGSDWFDDEGESDPSMDLPHWTEPGVPGPTAADGAGDPSMASVTGPRWRGSGADFDDVDDVRIFADADPTPPPAMLSTDDDESFPAFDPSESAAAPNPPNVVRITDDSLRGAPAPSPPGYGGTTVGDPSLGAPMSPPPAPTDPNMYAPAPYAAAPVGPGPGPVGPGMAAQGTGPAMGPPGGPGVGFGAPVAPGGSDSGRDMASAIGVGVLLAAVAAGALYLGPLYATILVALAMFLSVAEFYNAARQVGYDPATFAGIAFTGFLPLAVYWRGLLAYPVVFFIAILASLLWYLFGASASRPIANIAMTLFGMAYVGILGSFAALMLISPSRVDDAIQENGVGLLLGAILCTVAYDVGAYFAGRAFGRTPLSMVSPNKTMEGLMGGVAASLVMSVLIIGMLDVAPWGANPGGLVPSIILGFVAAIAATLGDLCESMLKRDMGVKDMGSILPGHGGLLDRFDSILFVVPITWATALALGIIEAPF